MVGFKDTVSFTRSAVGKDALGGETRPSFVAVGSLTNVKCSIQRETGRLVDDFMRRGIKVPFSILSKINLSALQIGDLGTDSAGSTYVVKEPDDMAGRGKVWCVLVDQIS